MKQLAEYQQRCYDNCNDNVETSLFSHDKIISSMIQCGKFNFYFALKLLFSTRPLIRFSASVLFTDMPNVTFFLPACLVISFLKTILRLSVVLIYKPFDVNVFLHLSDEFLFTVSKMISYELLFRVKSSFV